MAGTYRGFDCLAAWVRAALPAVWLYRSQAILYKRVRTQCRVMDEIIHPQEDLLVVKALVNYRTKYYDVRPSRSDKAWEIAEEIAYAHGLELDDAAHQIDVNFL